MGAESLEEHADRIVAEWPPLTDEQLDRIAALLRVGSRVEQPKPKRRSTTGGCGGDAA